MKAIKIIIFFFCIGVSGLLAGNTDRKNPGEFNKRYESAETYFRTGNFSEALYIYMELYDADENNFNLCYKLGACYLKIMKGKEKAVLYLEKAVTAASPNYNEDSYEERRSPLLTHKLLGEAYHRCGKFDLAIASFEKFIKAESISKNRNDEMLDETDRKIEMCITAKKLIDTPVNVKIENMGRNVNSPFPDYSPVFTADQSTMIFTSGRPGNVGGKTYNGGKYFEDIYISNKTDSGWSQAMNIGPPINTVDNEASVGISADGQEILIYKDDMGDGNIYSTSLHGNTWTTPKKLNAHINSKYWEPSAFITADGNTLYFTSDRPGGYGGRDLYKSTKDSRGEWGKATNLGSSINTPYDEDAPFMHPDGVTLYFSSNGHKTMGGFDIFESKQLSDGNWDKPVNVGYPINSPDDDVFYVVSPSKKTAYYTSIREEGYGEKDNYMITFPDVKETSLALQKGVVSDSNLLAKNIKITITDNETQEVVGVYHPNSKTGKYLFILTPGKNYNISYEADGFLFYSENRYIDKEANYNEVTKAVKLVPIADGAKVVLNNIFFDFDKAVLHSYSNVELNRVYDFLIKHPNLSIEIAGYTDSKGDDEYNKKLSTERAMAVVNYLLEKGIKKERLIGVGRGKADPLAPNQNADGSDNPDGRQMNRRVELKIIEIK